MGDDAALRRVFEASRQAGRPGAGPRARPLEVGLLGGDLCRTVGGPGDSDRLYGDAAVRMVIDAVRVDSAEGDGPWWFLAHLVAHRRGWRGDAAVAMNAEWLKTSRGMWKLGPRAHPNDGLVDCTTGRLGWRDRGKARRRAASGDHLPHPALTVTRAASVELVFDRPTPVRLDGEPIGAHRRVSLTVEPDALVVVV